MEYNFLKYKIKDYIEILEKNNQLINVVNCYNILEEVVEDLSYNSKEVEKGTLFICKGFENNFKEEYLIEAIRFGALAYVSQTKYDINSPCIIVKDSYIALSILSNLYYNNPEKDLNIIGITGTKGKSTTSEYLKCILDEYLKSLNKKDTAIISSIDTYDGIEKFKSHITTPESLDIYRHLYNAKISNIQNVIMEISSQALKFGRVYSLNFNIGVFLNISEDHVSNIEHADFEDYFSSKLKLFEKTKVACINMDSYNYDRIKRVAEESNNKIVTFSCKNKVADIFAYDIIKDKNNIKFKVRTPNYNKEFILTMPGLFNIENALAAISVSYIMNIPEVHIYNGLAKAKSSGRMEIYSSKDEKIVSIVDYAHNKLSFEKIYETVKKEYPDRKVVTIFGCPGKKAYIRRRDLGLLSGKNSDIIYLTADDPSYENIYDICKEVSDYVEEYTANYQIIEDREEAIKKAVYDAVKCDERSIILILGKGSETTQKIGSEFVNYIGDATIVKLELSLYDSKYN